MTANEQKENDNNSNAKKNENSHIEIVYQALKGRQDISVIEYKTKTGENNESYSELEKLQKLAIKLERGVISIVLDKEIDKILRDLAKVSAMLKEALRLTLQGENRDLGLKYYIFRLSDEDLKIKGFEVKDPQISLKTEGEQIIEGEGYIAQVGDVKTLNPHIIHILKVILQEAYLKFLAEKGKLWEKIVLAERPPEILGPILAFGYNDKAPVSLGRIEASSLAEPIKRILRRLSGEHEEIRILFPGLPEEEEKPKNLLMILEGILGYLKGRVDISEEEEGSNPIKAMIHRVVNEIWGSKEIAFDVSGTTESLFKFFQDYYFDPDPAQILLDAGLSPSEVLSVFHELERALKSMARFPITFSPTSPFGIYKMTQKAKISNKILTIYFEGIKDPFEIRIDKLMKSKNGVVTYSIDPLVEFFEEHGYRLYPPYTQKEGEKRELVLDQEVVAEYFRWVQELAERPPEEDIDKIIAIHLLRTTIERVGLVEGRPTSPRQIGYSKAENRIYIPTDLLYETAGELRVPDATKRRIGSLLEPFKDEMRTSCGRGRTRLRARGSGEHFYVFVLRADKVAEYIPLEDYLRGQELEEIEEEELGLTKKEGMPDED